MSAQNPPSIDDILIEVARKAERYDWAGAGDLCQRTLENSDIADAYDRARVTEFLAKSRFQSAFQSSNRIEFKRVMGLALSHYEQSGSLYELAGQDSLAKRSKARGVFAGFWINASSDERRRILEECVALSDEALVGMEKHSDKRNLAETRLDILSYLVEGLLLANTSPRLEKWFQDAVEKGRRCVAEFEDLGDDEKLLVSLHLTLSLLTVVAEYVLEPSQFQALSEESERFGKQILEISQKIGSPYANCLAAEASGDVAFDLEGNYNKAVSLYETAAAAAEQTKDAFIIGRVLFAIAAAVSLAGQIEEYVEPRNESIRKGIECASNAIAKLKVPSHTSYLSVTYACYAACYIALASHVETVASQKREYLNKAMEIAAQGTGYEKYTWGWGRASHESSKSMYLLATISEDPREKIQLLSKALVIREQTLRLADSLFPNSWGRGVQRNYLALIKAELSRLEENKSTKLKLLEEAASDLDECLNLCTKWSSVHPGFLRLQAQYTESYGDTLFQLQQENASIETAIAAVKAYEDTIGHLTKTEQTETIAPLNWKIGKVFDSIGDYEKASESYQLASQDYRHSAKKIPALASTFEDLALYMDSGSRIESARLHHNAGEYEQAADDYLEASKILQKTKAWPHLSKHYVGCAILEKGEHLSRQEKHTASFESFNSALNTFREAKIDLQARLKDKVDREEEVELNRWLEIVSARERFCEARMQLEEANTLDKKGEKGTSARKFHSASAIFEELLHQASSPRDRAELVTLAEFCNGWAKMKEAEANVSPELFAEAAQCFTNVVNATAKERLRPLAFANASICKALEAGTRFRLSRDIGLYSEVKRHLEAAADYYQEAGFKRASDWTRATQRSFDAIVYLANAEIEVDSRKKAEFYHLAERHTELAAKLYGEAGFSSKKEEALRYLGKAREGMELLAPIETLAQTPYTSGVHITPVSFTGDQVLGLERFENASVVGNVMVPQPEVDFGSDLPVELEVVNVGRTTATLVKLENLSAEGLALDRQRSPYPVEDDFVHLRGKRLDYLKTHKIQFILKAVHKGSFELRPRVHFVDEKGSYRSYDFDPALIRVRDELAGKSVVPEPIAPGAATPLSVRFENPRAKEVFEHLAKEFLKDYMSRRLYVEKAGWRSLMDLVRELRIPRSSVYGPRGRSGPVLTELERRGLVETRIFPEERGRGGSIMKVRVSYDNDIVRKLIEQFAMQGS